MPETGNAPKVAVIMPAYNAEKTVAASVKSVLEQSFSDLELIVVDDGSTDGTARLLSGLAASDRRLRPVTVANGGPAKARNFGIELVREGTDYVLFLDADDLLDRDALETALSGMEDGEGADLVILGFSIVDAKGERRDYRERDQLIRPEDLGEAFPRLYKANLLNQVWGKLYRAKLLTGQGGVRFRDYRWGEDRLFMFDCLERASSVRVLSACKYRYMMHKGESLISSYYPKKFQVCLEADRRAEELGARFGSEDQAALRYMFAKSVFSCLTTLFSPSCPLSRREKRRQAAAIVGSGQVRRRCRETGRGFPAEFLCAVLQRGSPGLALAVFHLVSLAGSAAPRLFTALKHRK